MADEKFTVGGLSDAERAEYHKLLKNQFTETDTAAAAVKETTKDEGILASLPLPVRLKKAMKADAAMRSQLIGDPSKLVQTAVLENPMLQPQEIEKFVKNSNMSEFVLREIARNKEWLGLGSIKEGLVWNPRTPLDISLKLLPTVREAELRKIARTRNLPGALVSAARKKVNSKNH